MEGNSIKRDSIIGARRLENYVWSILLLIGGLGFILASCSSYFKINLLPFNRVVELNFVPQGVLMLFYGLLGLLFSGYILLTILWDVGGGYNEYDTNDEVVRIVRKGFPGENRNILLSYSLKEIKAIEVEIRDGLNPRRTIYLVTIDKRKIPLTDVGQPLPLSIIEEKAITIAKFLNIPYSYKQ
jgi:uncharacterized membrane protein YsdA (DUF1294 family)